MSADRRKPTSKSQSSASKARRAKAQESSQKDAESNPKAPRENLDFPDIETIKSVHDTYREMLDRDTQSLAQVAARLSIDPSLLNRRIDRFENAVNAEIKGEPLRVFKRGRGIKTVANEDSRVVQLMSDVADMVEAYSRISTPRQRAITVRFASSLAACTSLSPSLFGGDLFKHVAFDLVHAKPRRLRKMVDRDLCDFALVAVSPQFQLQHPRVLDHVDLPMALITPRGHRAEDASINWNRLAYLPFPMVLLREEPDRYPMPAYPTELFPKNLTVHRLGSTSLCLSLVMDGGAMTISLPQFLSKRQREYVNIMEDPQIPSVRLALLAANRVRKVSPERQAVLERVEQGIRELMSKLNDWENLVSTTMNMYHVTHTDRLRWLQGTLTWRHDGDNLSGLYKIRSPETRKDRRYELRGHVSRLEGDPRQHVACRAVSTDEDDEFVLELLASDKEQLHKQLTGIWAGRPTWHSSDRSRAFVGPAVVSVKELTPDELNGLVHRHVRDNDTPALSTPAELLPRPKPRKSRLTIESF